MSSSSTRSSSIRNPFHNPLPSSLSSECKKAGQILESFVNPQFFSLDVGIPPKVLARAKGLVIFTSLKAGFMGSVRFGSGLIVARLPDGTWSAPSAMATAGVGFGGQIGFELTDFVFVLNTNSAVETFTQSGSITLGGNVSLALGPFGRNAEVGGAIGPKGVAGMFAYSKTRGIFGGATVESGMIGERPEANEKMYKRKITSRELLSGKMSPPRETAPLMTVLNSDMFRVESPVELPPELPSNEIHERMAELPSQPSDEPPQGIPELAAGQDQQLHPQPAELATGHPHEIFELSSHNPHDASHELDTPEQPSRQSSKPSLMRPSFSLRKAISLKLRSSNAPDTAKDHNSQQGALPENHMQ